MEVSVKLSPVQAHRVEQQIEAHAIPDHTGVATQLEETFGQHTFFVHADGLNIVEPLPDDAEAGNLVSLGEWADAEHTKLKLHRPVPTAATVEFGAPGEETDEEDLE
jgi:hypothetical protein